MRERERERDRKTCFVHTRLLSSLILILPLFCSPNVIYFHGKNAENTKSAHTCGVCFPPKCDKSESDVLPTDWLHTFSLSHPLVPRRHFSGRKLHNWATKGKLRRKVQSSSERRQVPKGARIKRKTTYPHFTREELFKLLPSTFLNEPLKRRGRMKRCIYPGAR